MFLLRASLGSMFAARLWSAFQSILYSCTFACTRPYVFASTLVCIIFPISARADSHAHYCLDDSVSWTSPWSVGIIGGGARLYHTALLDILPNQPQCCSYERGESWGFSGGITGEYNLIPSALSISTRLLLAHRPLELSATISSLLDGRPIEYFNPRTLSYDALFRHYTYRVEATVLSSDIGITIRPFATASLHLPLYARLSADVSVPVGALPVARQTTRILANAPDLPQFLNGNQESVDVRENAIPSHTPSFGVSAALGVEFPLASRLVLGAEAAYRYGISNQSAGATAWQMNALNGMIGLRWIFDHSSLPESATPENPAEETEQSPIIPPAVVIQALDGHALGIQETVVTQTFPLLPYIFFDSASVVVRERYNPRIGIPTRFNEHSLPKDMMQIYYHLLHIVGRRMKAHPTAVLTITGTTDGKEWANADQRQILAMQRARTVASFLTGFWGIPAQRIRLATRDTPVLPSSSRYAEGDEENRRVELSANSPEILAPVVHSQFLEFTPLQDTYSLFVRVQHPEEAASYTARLELMQQRSKVEELLDTLALASGLGSPPERLSFALSKGFSQALLHFHTALPPLRAVLRLNEHSGAVRYADTHLPVELSKNRYEISRLNLIVFDFDRDDMRAGNEILLRRFTQESILPSSLVRITGSTDRLGEMRYNQELSTSRAKAVQEVMRRVNPRIQFVSVRGTGASILPFDNNTPEGRYYCRTVSIDVQTPRQ